MKNPKVILIRGLYSYMIHYTTISFILEGESIIYPHLNETPKNIQNKIIINTSDVINWYVLMMINNSKYEIVNHDAIYTRDYGK